MPDQPKHAVFRKELAALHSAFREKGPRTFIVELEEILRSILGA